MIALILCAKGVVEIDDAEIVRFESPAWLKPFTFFTHRTLLSEDSGIGVVYSLSEQVTGYAVISKQPTRELATSIGLELMTRVGKTKVVERFRGTKTIAQLKWEMKAK